MHARRLLSQPALTSGSQRESLPRLASTIHMMQLDLTA